MPDLLRAGYWTHDSFVAATECEELLADIAAYGAQHDVPLVQRAGRGRSLYYRVINGDEVAAHLPRISALYQRVNDEVNNLWGSKLAPLDNRTVGVNVNITPPGGEYRWHYDRNAATAVLYLNAVAGGEVELYPNFRVFIGRGRLSRLQQLLDRALQTRIAARAFDRRKAVIAPTPGYMVVMRGDRCLHSVRAVEGERDRICIVMSYDVPGATFQQAEALDRYLYTPGDADHVGDPNYATGGPKRASGEAGR